MSRDALVVGINTYQHLPALQAPAQDAESVARCLEGFGECRVVRLPEAIVQQKPAISHRGVVTTPMLEAALIKLFKPAGKNIPQTAIFYYSGHGMQRQAGIQEGYLATSEANPSAGHYGLSLHWLRRLLQESPVRQRVILLDCCNSGEFFNMLEADPGAGAGTDRLFMAAAREYEAAYESLDGSHSVFTKALLSGLNPYKVKGGIVNGHSLTDTVNRELKGELQQPLFESSGSEIVLTRLASVTPSAREDAPPLLERLQKFCYRFCPFPGEAPFAAAHSEFFFGRDEVTQTLVNRVRASRLCALVGASGVGKTSLLQAGLMPRLAQNEGESPWQARYLALGTAPIASLAEAFVDASATGLNRAEQLRRAESFLQQGPEGFCQLVKAAAGEGSLVLVLDQFEALLTPGLASDRDRRLVIDCLTMAVQQAHLPLRLVLGLRADCLACLAEFPQFHALVLEHRLAMPTMTYNQLKATIVGPLEKVGFRYDANLVYTLLLDVVSAPANLALLQLTLKTLWMRREDSYSASEPPCLTLAAYAEMGGIRNLLNQRAGHLYQSLSVAEQGIAQRIFLGLCDLGEGTALSRRQLMLAELVTETMPQETIITTLNKLIAARLVVAQGPAAELAELDEGYAVVPGWAPAVVEDDASTVTSSLFSTSLAPTSLGSVPLGAMPLGSVPLGSTSPGSMPPGSMTKAPYFDIAHEALIRNWPLLQQWLQAHGPMVKQQRAIEVAAQEWSHQQQPDHADYYLTKTRLIEAKTFRQAHPEQLSVLASSYLSACDRHTRRSRRQRHLVRLLIPLSMATGMLTAYGHSYMTRPSNPLIEAGDSSAADSSLANSSFELLPSTPSGAMPPQEESHSASALGSPQAGVVRTDLLNLTLGAMHGSAPLYHRRAAPLLQGAMVQSTQGLKPMVAQANALKTAAERSIPAAIAPVPGDSSLPTANQVVKLESTWVLPTDPSVVMQIWCTDAAPEPVCFTTTAARHP